VTTDDWALEMHSRRTSKTENSMSLGTEGSNM